MSHGFGSATPIFRVADLRAALAHYIDVLGFEIDWEYPGFVSVSRDHCTLFLCDHDQGNPGVWVWVGVPDVEALHAEYVAKGAKIRTPPTNFKWALEMQVEDLDGHVLRFGSESKPDQPFGPWRDMWGNLWGWADETGWTRDDAG